MTTPKIPQTSRFPVPTLASFVARERVKAMRYGGGKSPAKEVQRWLTKWGIESQYFTEGNRRGLPEFIAIANGEEVLYPDNWIVLHPKSGNMDILSDKEFKDKYK
jgi:hypothetical protein